MVDLLAVAIEIDPQHFMRIEIGQVQMAFPPARALAEIQAVEQYGQVGLCLAP